MTTYWFRPKQYGYGATPVTWQGWAITLATMVVVVAATVTVAGRTALDLSFWVAVAVVFAAISALVTISRRKTDGDWRWRWGDR
jgi:O-antigen/teichoic acid export membrane protein